MCAEIAKSPLKRAILEANTGIFRRSLASRVVLHDYHQPLNSALTGRRKVPPDAKPT
jgi:hypothetical protein